MTLQFIPALLVCLAVAPATLALPVAPSQRTEDPAPLQEHNIRKRSETKPCASKGVVGSEPTSGPRSEGFKVNDVLVHVPLLPGEECPEGSMIDHMGGCRRPFLPGVVRKDHMPGIRPAPMGAPPEGESHPSTTPSAETGSSTTTTTPASVEGSSSVPCTEGDAKGDSEAPSEDDSTADAS